MALRDAGGSRKWLWPLRLTGGKGGLTYCLDSGFGDVRWGGPAAYIGGRFGVAFDVAPGLPDGGKTTSTIESG